MAPWSGRRTGLALVYHRIDRRRGDPGRELVPAHSLELFEAQLAHLRDRYRLVAASDLLAAATSRQRGARFPLAVTFDDDLPSHLRLAIPALQRIGVPATFFVSGASLERPFTFWWERLQSAVDRGLPVEPLLAEADIGSESPRENIHKLALDVQTLPADRKAAVAAGLLELLGDEPPEAGMRRDEMKALASAGFEVGFHTRHHHYLPLLEDDALDVALTEGRDELEGILGRRLTLIAYPHGGADRRIAAAARAAGYRLGFTTHKSRVEPGSDPHLLPRVEPSFGPLPEFERQVARALRRRSGA